MSSNSECAICYSEKRNFAMLSCGHSFHVGCLTKWWGTQFNTTDGCISCPMCRAEPSKEDTEYMKIRGWALTYTRMGAKGEEAFKRWSKEIKTAWQHTPTRMDQLLDAPEFFPRA